jgi:SagB-type dehydrogenase family enzyme
MHFDNDCSFIVNHRFKGNLIFDNELEEKIFTYLNSRKNISYKSIISKFQKTRSTQKILSDFVKNNIFYCLPENAVTDIKMKKIFENLQDLFSTRKKASELQDYFIKEQSKIEEYHKNLLNKSEKYRSSKNDPWINTIKIPFDTPYRSGIKKSNNEQRKAGYLIDLLNERFSCREFSTFTITFQHLAFILQESCGFGLNKHRTIGSGGAFYPIEIWGGVFDIKQKEMYNALFHFNPYTNSIEILNKKSNLREIMKEVVPGDYGALEHASLILIPVCNLKFSSQKYEDFAFQLAMIESGMISQNIVLASIEMGLQTLIIGGLHEFELIDLLKLKFPAEFPVMAIAVGKAKDG